MNGVWGVSTCERKHIEKAKTGKYQQKLSRLDTVEVRTHEWEENI